MDCCLSIEASILTGKRRFLGVVAVKRGLRAMSDGRSKNVHVSKKKKRGVLSIPMAKKGTRWMDKERTWRSKSDGGGVRKGQGKIIPLACVCTSLCVQ